MLAGIEALAVILGIIAPMILFPLFMVLTGRWNG